MGTVGEEKLRAFRLAQGEKELERKWNKAKGRWSNQYWAQEWLDLAAFRGHEMFEKLQRHIA